MATIALLPDNSVFKRREKVRDLVLAHGWNATCYQTVNPIFDYAFFPDLEAVVAYVRTRRRRVVAGAPICPPEAVAEVLNRFENLEQTPSVYFGAGERVAERPHRAGLVSLGAQPVWNPQTWNARALSRPSLRYQFNRAANKGVTIREWSTPEAENSGPLRQVLDEWLAFRGLPPLHFLVEPETLDYLRDRRTFVASVGGKPVAFLNLCPIPGRNGWLTEQFPRLRRAPNGAVELLMHHAAQTVAAEGASYLTMGLVPFCCHGEPDINPFWLRAVMSLARRTGRRLYSIEGLDGFKSKFLPESWEPVYAVTPGRRFGQIDFLAIAEAFFATDPVPQILKSLSRYPGPALD
jgi:phosphatidylglycerol lysyltransferase